MVFSTAGLKIKKNNNNKVGKRKEKKRRPRSVKAQAVGALLVGLNQGLVLTNSDLCGF